MSKLFDKIYWTIMNPYSAWYRSKVVHWYQRAKWGYSDRDMWNLDIHLASILADACPRHITGDEKWNADMKLMGELFSSYEEDNFDWLNPEADKRVREAIGLLAENFRGLWT